MVTRLAPDTRALFASAEAEARTSRSAVVEPEHLLLAMSTRADTDAGLVLAAVGLTHDAIEQALDREVAASLAVAGVSGVANAQRRPGPEPPRRLRLSTSFKAALQRSVTAAKGSRQIRPAHVLLGVLGAQVGTVPRALQFAGVDQAELASLAEHALLE